MFRRAHIAFALVLVACGSSGPADAGPPDPYDGPVTFELGEGPTTFRALAVGMDDTMELDDGIQGGYHLNVAFRVHGLLAEGSSVSVDVALASDGTAISTGLFRELSNSRVRYEEDHFVRSGDQLRLIGQFSPAVITGERVRITATFMPRTGAPLVAEAFVIVRNDRT